MSFEFGSDSPEIKNPFKQEGMLFVASGLLVLVAGVVSLLTLRTQIVQNDKLGGWLNLLICIVLLLLGSYHLTRGLFKIFRFYVGRGIPSSLSPNRARSESHATEAGTMYTAEELDRMMTGRKNVTYREPVTLLDRMLYSIFPNLLFLPYPLRNYLHVLVQNVGYSIIALAIYLLSLLSGSLGLTSLTNEAVSHWLSLAFGLFLIGLWGFHRPSAKPSVSGSLLLGKRSTLVAVTIGAVLLPALAELIATRGVELPLPPFQPGWRLLVVLVLSAALGFAAILLAKLRSELYVPLTEVSEFREHWQENVHPKDFFRSLDMEFASLRYKEFPNRVYRTLNPNLNMEGSMDKGSFHGDTIQETQPVYEEMKYPPLFKQLRLYVAVGGHALVVLAAVLLYVLNQYDSPPGPDAVLNGLYTPLLLWIFGSSAIVLSHICWAELHFKSFLIQFQGEGTYTESKLSVGMAYTDSTRSENTVVRTSFSPWVLVTEIVTSTQASSDANNLSGPRLIMSMRKGDTLLYHLVAQIRQFLGSRQSIAAAVSEKDLQSIRTIYSLNEVAPSQEKLAASKDNAGKITSGRNDSSESGSTE